MLHRKDYVKGRKFRVIQADAYIDGTKPTVPHGQYVFRLNLAVGTILTCQGESMTSGDGFPAINWAAQDGAWICNDATFRPDQGGLWGQQVPANGYLEPVMEAEMTLDVRPESGEDGLSTWDMSAYGLSTGQPVVNLRFTRFLRENGGIVYGIPGIGVLGRSRQGKGYGRGLMILFLQYLATKETEPYSVEMWRCNPHSTALLERLGFTRYDEDDWGFSYRRHFEPATTATIA